MVAKFLFVSKCPGIGAALYRNGIISILFSTMQTFDKFFWKCNCPGFTSHCTGLDHTLPPTRYSSSSGNDSRKNWIVERKLNQKLLSPSTILGTRSNQPVSRTQCTQICKIPKQLQGRIQDSPSEGAPTMVHGNINF